jgi:L-iditol 2-dehydrogenase
MHRVAKHAGIGNIAIEETAVPRPAERQVLVKLSASLISRGSEILARYQKEEPVDHSRMGYSAAGTVVGVGPAVADFAVGDRVSVVAPHAEYVVGELDTYPQPRVVKLPAEVSFEAATFLPLATSANVWCRTADIQRHESVVAMGQGLVGSLCMQVAKQYQPRQVIAVDALPLRCELATRLGADQTVNASEQDPVTAVRELTGGRGAEVVLETVGGPPGVKSFAQSLELCAAGGRVVLISLYHGQALPLDASAVMNKRVLGGNLEMGRRAWASALALRMLADRRLPVEEMVTHRLQFMQAPEAFHLLNDRLGETLGVVLTYEE